jgi:endonuclease III
MPRPATRPLRSPADVSRKETLPPVGGERVAQRRERADKILERLTREYPGSKTALTWRTPYELLIATILSAQCTDERVNQVTPGLFEEYATPADLAAADQETVEAIVQPTGFFRQKAKNIRGAAARLVETFDGEMPQTIEELTSLPGVARKTANVVISNCFPERAAGIAVDTHVQRIARRLGWTRAYPPEQVERDLMRLLDRSRWNHVTHLLIDHGRATCTALRPRCDDCLIADLCPSFGRFTESGSAAEPRRRQRPRPARARGSTRGGTRGD